MSGGIVHRTILACRETLAAGFSERLTGMLAGDSADVLTGPLPEGVTCSVCTGRPHNVETLDPLRIDLLHEDALGLAWRDGAWDMTVTRHPRLDGPDLGLVSANRRWADPMLEGRLLASLRRGALVTWDWRPMRAGPAMRVRAHLAKDRTLRADGGRDGAPIGAGPRINWSRTGGCCVVIRLGKWSEAHRPAPPRPRYGPDARATDAQRGYIAGMCRRLGRAGEPLPAALTRREASAIIDALQAEAGR